MPQEIANTTERFGNFTCGASRGTASGRWAAWFNRMGGNGHQILMLTGESLDERVARFDAFAKDPERARALADNEKNGPIVQQVATTMLRPTAFSPMR